MLFVVRRSVPLWWFFGVLLVVAGCSRETSEPAIGVITDGGYLAAAEMAVEDARAAHSDLRVTTLVRRSSSVDAMSAVAEAGEFLAQRGLVGVVGHVTSGSSLATAQLYNDAQVVQLSPTATSRLYGSAGAFSFRMVPPDDVQAAFLAELVAGDFPRGARVALLYMNDDYGRGLRTDLTAALDSSRYPIVIALPHVEQDSSREVAARAARAVRDARPDILVFLGSAPALAYHIVALRAELPTVSILGSDAVSSWARVRPDLREWTGVRYVDFLDVEATEAGRTFAARYAERTGHPATGPDALTYDATRLLLEAVADGARTGESVRAFLASLGDTRPRWAGVSGPVRFTAARHADRALVLRTIPEARP